MKNNPKLTKKPQTLNAQKQVKPDLNYMTTKKQTMTS